MTAGVFQFSKNEVYGDHIVACTDIAKGTVLFTEDPCIYWNIDDEIKPEFEFLKDGNLKSFASFIQQLSTDKINYLLPNFYHLEYKRISEVADAKLQYFIEVSQKLALTFNLEWQTMFSLLTIPLLNGHNLQNGCGLLLRGSKFNHSCDPNCVAASIDKELSFKAIKPIKSGEMLTISYLSADELIMPTILRQYSLLMKKSFLCNCDKCTELDPKRAFICECGGNLCKMPGKEHLFDFIQVLELYKIDFTKTYQYMCDTCSFTGTSPECDLELLQDISIDAIDDSTMSKLAHLDPLLSTHSWLHFRYLQLGLDIYMDTIDELDETAYDYAANILEWLLDNANPQVILSIGLFYAQLIESTRPDLCHLYAKVSHFSATLLWEQDDEDLEFIQNKLFT